MNGGDVIAVIGWTLMVQCFLLISLVVVGKAVTLKRVGSCWCSEHPMEHDQVGVLVYEEDRWADEHDPLHLLEVHTPASCFGRQLAWCEFVEEEGHEP